MKTPRARRRLDPEARRAELLDAAERVLRKNPNARVEDVVLAARAAKGTFYLYFESWEELIYALRERVSVRFYARIPKFLPSTEAEWWALTEELAIGFVDFTLELGGVHQAVFHTPLAKPPGDDAVQVIARLIEMGAAAGVFAETDAQPLARLIFAALHETVDAIESGADRERALAAMRHVLRRTLACEGRSKP